MVVHQGVRCVSTVQVTTKSRREHRVVVGVEKDGKGSTSVKGANDLRSTYFYFTNVSEQIPYFLLRNVFKVCGMLSNVFLAKNRNARGHVYGFACYNNVCNLVSWFRN